MKRWVFVGYVAVEIAAFWAMAHFFGWGWAILLTVAAMAVGVAVLGNRAREIVAGARSMGPDRSTPGQAFTDSALFAGASILTILPGVVGTVVGLALLSRPVRRRMEPVVTAAATRKVQSLADRVSVIGMAPNGYVDGTVVREEKAEGSVIVETTVRNPDGTIHVDRPALPPVIDGTVIDGGAADEPAAPQR
ncbi:MAG: FxsA family protein [Gordonia sp. (in: high G+C Gram-positive bacteria)]|uniref:FxsA family protein n=1 Tax=Gordonia sp. (in: high G+C Gram-positive bacteria) TaxID=84139 RepID=UPI0039E51885